jgi:hypothetical protein
MCHPCRDQMGRCLHVSLCQRGGCALSGRLSAAEAQAVARQDQERLRAAIHDDIANGRGVTSSLRAEQLERIVHEAYCPTQRWAAPAPVGAGAIAVSRHLSVAYADPVALSAASIDVEFFTLHPPMHDPKEDQ